MSDILDNPPAWIKNSETYEPIDGQLYIIAVPVQSFGKKWWQIDQVQVINYDDGLSLYQGEDPYTDWEWRDVEYYMEVMPRNKFDMNCL